MLSNKFDCIICGERMRSDKAHINIRRTGICADCMDTLPKTAAAQPYEGTGNISYIMSPFEYTGNLRRSILKFKFNNCRAYAPVFAEAMREYLDSFERLWERFDYIIPVPLHSGRLRERGYNQSELIAEFVSEYLGVPMRTDMLSRIRATKQQSSLKRFDRLENVRGAFESRLDLHEKNILLFDDICTTGSTLEACAVPLTRAGAADICALTLAIHEKEKIPLITY